MAVKQAERYEKYINDYRRWFIGAFAGWNGLAATYNYRFADYYGMYAEDKVREQAIKECLRWTEQQHKRFGERVFYYRYYSDGTIGISLVSI